MQKYKDENPDENQSFPSNHRKKIKLIWRVSRTIDCNIAVSKIYFKRVLIIITPIIVFIRPFQKLNDDEKLSKR